MKFLLEQFWNGQDDSIEKKKKKWSKKDPVLNKTGWYYEILKSTVSMA